MYASRKSDCVVYRNVREAKERVYEKTFVMKKPIFKVISEQTLDKRCRYSLGLAVPSKPGGS